MPHHPHEERLDVRGEPTGLGFIVPPQDAQPRLIDFDFDHDDDDEHPTRLSMMPTPEQPSSRPPFIANNDPQHSVYPITERGDDPDDDIHAATGMYRSPPFIEAQLPDEEDDEEAPLPIPPRILGEERKFGVERRDVDTVDHGFAGFSPIGAGGGGHVRSPTIPRYVRFYTVLSRSSFPFLLFFLVPQPCCVSFLVLRALPCVFHSLGVDVPSVSLHFISPCCSVSRPT